MSENLTSNNIDNNEFNLNTEEIDYEELISRLEGIKKSIVLLEKKLIE